jgi:hypothetical protein
MVKDSSKQSRSKKQSDRYVDAPVDNGLKKRKIHKRMPFSAQFKAKEGINVPMLISFYKTSNILFFCQNWKF